MPYERREEGRVRQSRKDWKRIAGDAAFWPVSMLASKHTRSKRLSQLRVIVFMFSVQFARHWPSEWSWPTVVALAVLAFALPADAMLARVPVPELLDAIHVGFSSIAKRTLDKFGHERPAPDDSIPEAS